MSYKYFFKLLKKYIAIFWKNSEIETEYRTLAIYSNWSLFFIFTLRYL